ncbi:MAG TPA: CHAT domain-containing protein [Agromyces sp.]|nr:CHAT domain-containing protein [Agromyces sp.]
MPAGEYDDLELRIDRDADGSYRVLASAPDGRKARGSFSSPISDTELDDFVLRVGLARRRGGSPEDRMQAIRSLGSTLFDALIRDDVGTVYYSARSAAAERDRGLRLTLRLSGSPELMRLPWEFLYKRPRFIAQSTRTPVVRALDVDSAMRPQRVRLPLRILGMVSSPSGYPELDAIAERANLERALEGPRRAGLVELTWLERATLAELARRVAEPDEIHVLHYIGHGAYDEATESGVLVLETPQGRAHDVSGEDIGSMLQDETSLRLVVLNACEGARTSHVDPFSGVATSLVNFDIPAVIGMQFEITDDAAIAFSESLYTGLARGMPIDAALAPARRAIIGAMLATEFGTPVLFLRDGDARLFEIEDAPQVAPPESAEEPLPEPAEEPVPEPADSVPVPADSVPVPMTEPEMPVFAEPSVEAEPEAPSASPEAERDAPVDAPVEAEPEAPAASPEVADQDDGPVAPTPEPSAGVAAAASLDEAAVATTEPSHRGIPNPAPVVLAPLAAALLVVVAGLFFAATSTPSIEFASAGFVVLAPAMGLLCVHYLTRPNRDGLVPAAVSAIATVFVLSTIVGLGGDLTLANWSYLLHGVTLILLGAWILFAGRPGASPFAASLRAPGIWVIAAGVIDVIDEFFWLSGAVPQPNWSWPLGVLGMAGGYVASAVLLAREQRSQPATGAVAAPAGTAADEPSVTSEPPTEPSAEAPAVVAAPSSTGAPETSEWNGEVTYERMTRRPTRATIRLRLAAEHVLVLDFGAGWKTIEVDGVFVPIPRGRIAEFGLRDGDVDRVCVLESSPPAAGARPETWRAARIESLVVDGVAIPLEQEEAEA